MNCEDMFETLVDICWEIQPFNSVVYVIHEDGRFQAITQNTDLEESLEGRVSGAIESHTLEELRYLADYCPYMNLSMCSYWCERFIVVVASSNPSKKDRKLLSLFAGILRDSFLMFEVGAQHV